MASIQKSSSSSSSSGAQVKEKVSTFESSYSSSKASTGSSAIKGSSTISSSYASNGHAISNGSSATGKIVSVGGYSSGSLNDFKNEWATVRISREEEKSLFAVLNERLAKYIEIVRTLNKEKGQLSERIRELQIFETTTKEKLESSYLTQINNSNAQIERISSENSKLRNDLQNALDDYNKLKAKYGRLEVDLRKAEEERSKAYARIEEINKSIKITEIRITELEKVNLNYKGEIDILQKQITDDRYKYDQLVKKCSEWEQKYLGIKNELELTKKTHLMEVEEYRHLAKIEWDKFIQSETTYQDDLAAKLAALRIEFDHRLEQNRIEIAQTCQIDFSLTTINANRIISDATEARNEASKYRLRINELEGIIASHDSIVAVLKQRIGELEELTRRSRIDADSIIHERDSALEFKIKEINEKIEKYHYLMNLKIRLDTELEAYRLLLEAEEARLHIGYVHIEPEHHSHSSRSFVTKGHSDVDVVIEEVNMDGNYVRITNKGLKEFNLGSWQIKSAAGNVLRKFKFQNNQTILPGKTITIWSPNKGGAHNPPDSIVMKAIYWPAGDRILAELLDENDTRKAWHESFYEVENVVHATTYKTTIGGGTLIS